MPITLDDIDKFMKITAPVVLRTRKSRIVRPASGQSAEISSSSKRPTGSRDHGSIWRFYQVTPG